MITHLKQSVWMKVAATLMVFGTTSLCFPYNVFAFDPNKPQKREHKIEQPKSRALTAKELETFSGRFSAPNPYYGGKNKFDIYYKGVNMRTGDFTLSATDLSFEGGYGIPINFSRSYSANAERDEGPFGYGWNMSVDLRTTAGAELKSGGAPVRSTPTRIRQKSTPEGDPNSSVSPVSGMVVTDASGQEETVQRDVDGIITSPAWDKNLYNPVYEKIETANGTEWILVSNQVLTPEGTIYQYEKEGAYTNGGVRPWYDPTATPEPSNVLKVTWLQDRYGNRTTYTYDGSPTIDTVRNNGTTTENRLVGVSMPNGRTITISWYTNINNAGPGARKVARIHTVTDGTRTVT
ncbi:MAG TPA: DUF6531 domain-containing protein, partial [Fimbriimonadaceae bacterium]|nr:DUF6531 domain-containing protein [Fimbriimonadaceae bacterium]